MSTEFEVVTRAETTEEVEELLKTLEENDRIRMYGEVYKVLGSRTNDSGTPFVEVKKTSSHSPGTRDIKPGSHKPVAGHGRGMVPHYDYIEKLEE